MTEYKIHRYRCTHCPSRETYRGVIPQKMPGAYLKPGTQYCSAGKKLRAFKPADPKLYPPSWCPKLKSPAEYRVYTYKDGFTWFMHQNYREMGMSDCPSGYEYAVRTSGHTDISAAAFQKALDTRSASEILGVPVSMWEVVEIDDGLRPYFLHITPSGANVLLSFNSDVARANQYERPDDA